MRLLLHFSSTAPTARRRCAPNPVVAGSTVLPPSQALVFFLAIAVDDIVFLLNELAEIQPDLRRRQPRISRISRIVNDLRRLDQVLGRQTAAVDANP
jgi:hypothetical protein